MARTRVKICGITSLQDLDATVAAGADAVGFVLYKGSKRAIALEDCRTLVRAVPAWVSTVVLTVNAEAEDIQEIIKTIRPSLLQFHGDETPEFCEQFEYPYLKAIRVGAPGCSTPEEILACSRQYGNAKGYLYDVFTPKFGGSGKRFDTSLLSAVRLEISRDKILIAGGLNCDNVAEVIAQEHPYAIDLSSGVEEAPGKKSAKKLDRFFGEVRRADASIS